MGSPTSSSGQLFRSSSIPINNHQPYTPAFGKQVLLCTAVFVAAANCHVLTFSKGLTSCLCISRRLIHFRPKSRAMCDLDARLSLWVAGLRLLPGGSSSSCGFGAKVPVGLAHCFYRHVYVCRPLLVVHHIYPIYESRFLLSKYDEVFDCWRKNTTYFNLQFVIQNVLGV